MDKINDLTIHDLEHLIESKILEFFGDPDSGLELKEEFIEKLKTRLETPHKKISHAEVLKNFGQDLMD